MAILVIIAFAAFILLFSASSHDQPATVDVISADAAAANFWLYHQALSQYVFAHPTTTGTIADTSLVFAQGYQRQPGWSNTVQGGILYTYSTQPMTPGTIDAISRRGGHAQTIGIVHSGVMTSWGSVSTPVPLTIADAAIVVIGN